MHHSRLTDAAITLHRVLTAQQIRYGVFGGFAVTSIGGPRASKDVDAIAAVSKDQIINILDGQKGFRYISQSRTDYVAFVWADTTDRRNAVLVEIFVEQFPGAQYGMRNIIPHTINVQGERYTQGHFNVLDPVRLFKGKLSAAATRHKFTDSVDLRWLESHFPNELRNRRQEIHNIEMIGLAMKRYPELQYAFARIGLNIQQAEIAAQNLDLCHLPPPQPGDVQRGILE